MFDEAVVEVCIYTMYIVDLHYNQVAMAKHAGSRRIAHISGTTRSSSFLVDSVQCLRWAAAIDQETNC